MDPIINVIAQDVARNPSFQQSVQRLRNTVIPYGNTLHPSDELLEAWYRFKENRIC
ncbi:hypothetical protein [Dyadobacter sp. CY323]|uniref:hypothetical protein n=1 Tax=Dyadobacter sp. CY323 TaxID=2907302 RepID=UPI001F347B60|nr:hypothetical protein [Dyadobacter sp. CY323]MCE6993064.1 hypothetical protein [Dyadobacter sp. CY323]